MSVPLVGCPICGKYPIDMSCVRDWLNAGGHPLHSEWQEVMVQYANEVVVFQHRAVAPPREEVRALGFKQWWLSEGINHMPRAGEPPEHATIAKLAWETVTAATQSLIAEWRELSEKYWTNADGADNNYADGMGDGTKDCADALEAALAATPTLRVQPEGGAGK